MGCISPRSWARGSRAGPVPLGGDIDGGGGVAVDDDDRVGADQRSAPGATRRPRRGGVSAAESHRPATRPGARGAGRPQVADLRRCGPASTSAWPVRRSASDIVPVWAATASFWAS